MATLVDFIGTDAGTGAFEAQELMTRTAKVSVSILAFKAHLFRKNSPPERQSRPAHDVAATEFPLLWHESGLNANRPATDPTEVRPLG